MNKGLVAIAALLIGLWLAFGQGGFPGAPGTPAVPSGEESAAAGALARPATGDQVIAAAFAEERSDVQVAASGVVERILSDDTNGSRHQRIIVRLASGQTVLIAHNIDLAPRVESLRAGDAISFNGEYEWNPQGGVIHWTHRDPRGEHVAGWVRHGGKTYQ